MATATIDIPTSGFSRLKGILIRFSALYTIVNNQKASLVDALTVMVILLTKPSSHIMLADDDEEDQELFIAAIREIEPSIKITVAGNGRELMKLLLANAATPPDVIFLDINMPFKNGQECLVEIRNDKRLKSIPIIIYTTSSSRNHIEETYKDGADFYISKPDSFHDLKVVAKKMLSVDWDKHTQPNKEKFVINAKAV